jgi:hypothetical protein
MLSSLAKVLLTSTAITPVLFTYAYVAYRAGAYAQCWLMLSYSQKNLECIDFTITKAEIADRENTGFLLLYLLPLFTSSFSSLNWSVWAPVTVVLAAAIGTGYSYHFNPLLGIMRWHFYKVETQEGISYVLITKKQLRSAMTVKGIGQLTEYIVLDLGGE